MNQLNQAQEKEVITRLWEAIQYGSQQAQVRAKFLMRHVTQGNMNQEQIGTEMEKLQSMMN